MEQNPRSNFYSSAYNPILKFKSELQEQNSWYYDLIAAHEMEEWGGHTRDVYWPQAQLEP